MSENRTLHRCGVCETPYTFGGPDPYLLPCLHSVCQTCHDADNTDTIRCGICQEDFKRNDVGDTKDVVTTKQVLLATIQNNAGAVLCTNNNDGNQAMSWCQKCEVFLCEHCQVSHEDSKVTRNHHVVALSELTCNFKGYTPQTKYCKIHAQYIEEHFDENCGIILCAMCVLTHHKTCSTTTIINDGLAENTLKEGIEHVSERLSLVKDLEGKVDGLELDIERNAQDLKEAIKHTFGQLRSVLDQRECEVLLDLEKCKEAEKASNASLLKLLQHEDSTSETLLHFIQSCLELCCPTEVLSLKKKIEAKIIANSATQLPQRIRQKSSITFSQRGLRPLTESMATFGETCTAYYTSGVEFLYVEEATVEQKARARKYLLPESFYLYENKPPCPGCIGCEDYDPSKVSVPSKVKAKSKSEETSPAPTIASVQVSSSAGSSTGASEGFCMFGQASGMSFSTLAAQGDAVGYAFKKDENRPFQWSGAGQQIFGTSPGGNRTNVDDDDVVQSDDIDFKPIIDLPELTEVKTGEEGWEVVYCQRSKLFRFVRDSNQWKERAVGDMKILKQDDKYRLLMRRDQEHKVACNHLIAGNMTLSPMSTSETAWCWSAQDYAENEAKIEQFALRFKTEELARQFKKKFEEVQELVRATESEDDDSEEESIMFEKRATLTYFENDEWKKLGMGNLKILYNDDLNGNQIDMETDDKQKVCNHVICREHSIKLENQKRACMWSAQDFSTDEPVRRDFKAAFSSVAAAEEFAKSFMEGVSLARDSELSEKISHEMDTPVIFSHGDATGADSESDGFQRKAKIGAKPEGTSLTKANSPQPDSVEPHPSGQIPQVQVPNLVNRAVPSSTSASTAKCVFQGKATDISIIGAKQEGIVKVVCFGAKRDGWVRMENLAENQILLNHDINTLRLVATPFNPQQVKWKRPHHEMKGGETVTLHFDNVELAQKLNLIIKKIQDAEKISEAISRPKPVLATSPSTFTVKTTTTQAPRVSMPGFTFTQTKSTTPKAPVKTDAMKKGTGDGPSCASTVSSVFTLGQNTGSPMPSFSNVAANNSATGFSGLKTRQHSFLTSPGKGHEEHKVEEYEPNVDFKPVIDLPDLVEMKTGEEDEEKVFGEWARLFRFDADTNQWKERGIGEVKILFNKAAKRYRILMRREQVLKICANHNITKDMKLTPVTGSDRAWCWSAMDCAEEEMKMEKLAIKFKTPELAGQFKECFEKSQDMIEDSPVKPVPEAI